MRIRSLMRLLRPISAVLGLMMVTPPQAASAAEQTAYLWTIRRGCHADALLEDAALSRIRAVGREIIALNVPATSEARGCHGAACIDLIRRSAQCSQLSGPVIGAELDEVPGPNGVVTRIRVWRSDIGGADDRQSVIYEFATCAGENCSSKLVMETTAKTLSRLLDRTSGPIPSESSSSQLAFPAPECLTAAGSFARPAHCSQPFGTTCREQDVALEPSGRIAVSTGKEWLDGPPSARPRGWEWLPVVGSIVGLGASIGLGVANEKVRVSEMNAAVGNMLTPAFWTGASLTVLLGVSSAGIIGDRYRREVRGYKQSSVSMACPLLVDTRPSTGAP